MMLALSRITIRRCCPWSSQPRWPLSSLFDITTFLLLWWVFHAQTQATQSLFQAGWFVEGLLSQTLIVHLIRTQKIPFLQSRPGTMLLAMTTLVRSEEH